jgi:hypothetical protein
VPRSGRRGQATRDQDLAQARRACCAAHPSRNRLRSKAQVKEKFQKRRPRIDGRRFEDMTPPLPASQCGDEWELEHDGSRHHWRGCIWWVGFGFLGLGVCSASTQGEHPEEPNHRAQDQDQHTHKKTILKREMKSFHSVEIYGHV